MNNGTLPAWYTINLPITFVMRAGMPSDNGLSEMWLNEYPRGLVETAQQYSDRIANLIEATFQAADRYGYRKISNQHRILALTISFPNRQRIVDSSLEDETRPSPTSTQPAPRSVLSSLR